MKDLENLPYFKDHSFKAVMAFGVLGCIAYVSIAASFFF